MLKKGPFMVEYFVTIGSFDFDCTFMSMKKMDSLNMAIELFVIFTKTFMGFVRLFNNGT